MVLCKSLIILKEFKKPSAKFLRVWAKNQWGLKFVEKILKFTYKNLNGKLTFSPFLSHFPGALSFYTALENNTIFLQQIFRFLEGEAPPSPCGLPCTYRAYPKVSKNDFYKNIMEIFQNFLVLTVQYHAYVKISEASSRNA